MPPSLLIQYIRRLAAPKQNSLSDRELLNRFASTRDEAAFEALVRRHGPMVLGLCQRMLHNGHNAEDVFQATLLVLARKASAQRWHESVGSWLYEVAYRLCLAARAREARRRRHEGRVAVKAPEGPLAEVSLREARMLLDEELRRLPERYRAPLILCYLEGMTRDEAARQLGWSLDTLKRRLGQGRALLKQRLTRRGLTLSVVLLAPGETVSAGLVEAAVKAAVAGPLFEQVTALAEAAMKMTSLSKLKMALAALLTTSFLAVGLTAHQALEAKQQAKPKPMTSGASRPSSEEPATRLDLFGDPLPEGAVARIGTSRLREQGYTCVLAYSPDGRRFAYASQGSGPIHICEAADGKPVRDFQLRALWPDFSGTDQSRVTRVGSE
jgi:RNA polymerase sigma factor (sigma-70 family)